MTADEAKKVREAGGLHVIGTERHDARRVDNQLRGRAGRQGDPGSSQFFLSLEDDLLRIFGGDRVKRIMDRFDIPEDQPMQMGVVSKAVGQAQARVEGAHFDMRKHLLEYDDVLNKQRSRVYGRRQEILGSIAKDALANLIFESVRRHTDKLSASLAGAEGYSPDPGELKKHFAEAGITGEEAPFPSDPSKETIESLLTKRSMETSLRPGAIQRLLGLLDMLWMNHLEDLEALSEAVGLRAYGQKDPLVEYREEAHRLYSGFWENFDAWVFSNLFKQIGTSDKGQATGESVGAQRPSIVLGVSVSPVTSQHVAKVGRNDPCPCGSGKKYKKCHGCGS